MTKTVIKIVYCGGWGYRPKADRIKDSILKNFPDANITVNMEATKTISGYLEVFVNDKLVHSKKNGDGYVDSDGKLGKIIQAVKTATEAN